LRSEAFEEEFFLVAGGEDGGATFLRNVRPAADALRAPTGNQMLRALTEEYMAENVSVRTERGFPGLDVWANSVLYLKYIVNEEQTRATLEEKQLVSPYASQIKSLLRRTIGDRVDTADLHFTRIVRLEREDIHPMNDVHRLGPNERAQGHHRLTGPAPAASSGYRNPNDSGR
jgi:hypothetical protein